MQKPAEILSSEEVAHLRHEAEAALEGQRANAQTRKERMLKVGCQPCSTFTACWYECRQWLLLL